MKTTPIFQQKKYSHCNEFFKCPVCLGDHFRVSFRAYLSNDIEYNPDTDLSFFWNEESAVFLFFNCKCLRCGFAYKKESVFPADFVLAENYLDDDFPYDFIVDYFKNLKDLKFNDECLEYLVNSMSKTPRYRITESQTTLKNFIKEAK